MASVRDAILVAMMTAFISPSAAAAQTPNATLPSRCVGQEIAPVSVVLACGDAGFIAEDLVWSNWGGDQPTASGTASVNTCDPDCATGGREEYPMTLVASSLRDCAYGDPHYTHVSYSFPGATPFPAG